MSKFAITGASGFLGQRLVSALAGHEVRTISLRSGAPAAEALQDADVVIHLAGEPVAQRWNSEVKKKIAESRSVGTRNLVTSLSEMSRPPRVLVSASASGYYGDRGDEVLTESSAPGTGFLPEVCVEWEREAQRAQEFGIRVVMIRISLVLHPDGGALKQMLPPFKAGVAGKLGSGKQWMPWIHVDDLIRLFVYATENESVKGPVNGNADAVRNEEFTADLARELHRPAVIPVPEFGLKVLFGEMAEILLASQRMAPEAARRAGFEFQHPTLPGALQDLMRAKK